MKETVGKMSPFELDLACLQEAAILSNGGNPLMTKPGWRSGQNFELTVEAGNEPPGLDLLQDPPPPSGLPSAFSFRISTSVGKSILFSWRSHIE
jgi:hypothetical protein